MTRWRDSGAYSRKRRRFRPEKRRRKHAFSDEGEPVATHEYDPAEEMESEVALHRLNQQSEKPEGLLSSMFGLFKKKRDKPRHKVPPPAEDHVRQILSVPRGIARLDAFERALEELTGTNPELLKPVALAYRKELLSLAEKAQIDLALLTRRADKCASALLDSGESELAGALLAKIGKRKRAAEIFVEAGDIDQLELLHADAELKDEGGPRFSARLAYERFEGLFAVNLRKEALGALEDASRLWPDNAVYREIADRFRERVPSRVVRIKHLDRVYHFGAKWPAMLGRGESSVLPLASPLISREHVELARDGGRVFVRDPGARGDIEVDGEVVHGACELPPGEHRLSIAGLMVRSKLDEGGLTLFVEQASEVHACIALPGTAWVSAGDLRLPLTFDSAGHGVLTPGPKGLIVDGGRVEQPLLLMRGDDVRAGDIAFKVL